MTHSMRTVARQSSILDMCTSRRACNFSRVDRPLARRTHRLNLRTSILMPTSLVQRVAVINGAHPSPPAVRRRKGLHLPVKFRNGVVLLAKRKPLQVKHNSPNSRRSNNLPAP